MKNVPHVSSIWQFSEISPSTSTRLTFILFIVKSTQFQLVFPDIPNPTNQNHGHTLLLKLKKQCKLLWKSLALSTIKTSSGLLQILQRIFVSGVLHPTTKVRSVMQTNHVVEKELHGTNKHSTIDSIFLIDLTTTDPETIIIIIEIIESALFLLPALVPDQDLEIIINQPLLPLKKIQKRKLLTPTLPVLL